MLLGTSFWGRRFAMKLMLILTLFNDDPIVRLEQEGEWGELAIK